MTATNLKIGMGAETGRKGRTHLQTSIYRHCKEDMAEIRPQQ